MIAAWLVLVRQTILTAANAKAVRIVEILPSELETNGTDHGIKASSSALTKSPGGRTAAFSRSQPTDSQLRRTSSRFCCKALFALPAVDLGEQGKQGTFIWFIATTNVMPISGRVGTVPTLELQETYSPVRMYLIGRLFGTAALPKIFKLVVVQFEKRTSRVYDSPLILPQSEFPSLIRGHDKRRH